MFSISFMLPMIYDYEPKAKDDPIARNMKRYLNRTNTALTPGVTVILETFPFLLKLPSWFPGATFKRASLECLEAGHDIKEIPFQMVEERMSTDITVSCFVADTLSRMKLFEEDDAVITTAVKEAACMAFAAAFETCSIQRYKPKRKRRLIDLLAKIDSPTSMIDHRCLTLTPFYVKYSGGTPWFHLVSRAQRQPVTSTKATSSLKGLFYLQMHGKLSLS